MITFITITYINDCYISINITLTVLKTLHFMASDSRNEKCVSLAYKFLIFYYIYLLNSQSQLYNSSAVFLLLLNKSRVLNSVLQSDHFRKERETRGITNSNHASLEWDCEAHSSWLKSTTTKASQIVSLHNRLQVNDETSQSDELLKSFSWRSLNTLLLMEIRLHEQ